MLKFLGKLLGSKSDRDIKSIQPKVHKINEEFAKLSTLSHDELRAKTTEFKNRISEYLSDIDREIDELKTQAELPETDMVQKTELYEKVDSLVKERDQKLEVILAEILPEAFAVVKETAKRFS